LGKDESDASFHGKGEPVNGWEKRGESR
jgi:hypothetical protein